MARNDMGIIRHGDGAEAFFIILIECLKTACENQKRKNKKTHQSLSVILLRMYHESEEKLKKKERSGLIESKNEENKNNLL